MIKHPPLVLPPNIKAPKNGYAYIYVSNENDQPVYFDNLQVSDNKGRIIEENHYYCFGLKIAGISSKKLGDFNEGMLDNKNLYNDKELIDEGDLDWYDYGFRNYDPQIGRFPQLDPLTDEYPYYTPYQYAGNEPIANVDLDGLEESLAIDAFKGAKDAVQQTVIVTSIVVKNTSDLALNAIKLGASFAIGVANAWTSNQVLGVGRTDAVKHGLTDRNGVAFQVGQIGGDVLSLVTGNIEVGGAATGELASVGGATVAAVPVALHGLSSISLGLYNLANGHIVYTSSSSINGETTSTKDGKDAHAIYNPGSNYSTNRSRNTLKNKKIPDAIDFKNKIVRELKPNNQRAVKRGTKQVEAYAEQLEKQIGEGWKTVVDTYEKVSDGIFKFFYGTPK